MSFLNRLNFLKSFKGTYSKGYGAVTNEDSSFEDAYRHRWQYDKVVRSTHGVNCTGSCSWRIFVKKGIVTWELQQVDYPETRPDMPNHEPRGCPRGASFSWYLYSAHRVKYPLVRSKLIEAYRNLRKSNVSPIEAYATIVGNKNLAKEYKHMRGKGSFVRASWNEVNELIAAANCYTIKNYGPDRVVGFSPIPAMSMVSYASGTRYLSMIGGTCLSFYDWYCDLPPASPQTWGEQTDVPESADWYNSNYLILWGSNVPMTRTPDAHFYTEVRYKGTKTVAVCPDFSEMAKFADFWLAAKQGTDAALALAMGHVILKEFYLDRQCEYFVSYAKQYTDLPMLVTLEQKGDHLVPSYFLRADNLVDNLQEQNNPQWKTICFDAKDKSLVVPKGSIGFRWGEKGKWNITPTKSNGEQIDAMLSVKDLDYSICDVAFNDFNTYNKQNKVIRKVPVIEVNGKDGRKIKLCTVFDLLVANYGINRGFEDENTAKDYTSLTGYTPAWQESITGVKAKLCTKIAREFAHNAEVTKGKSMVIVGAGINHWYHMDMTYRAIINMLMMCGTIGKSGGGWAHYVGQEKLRPQTGWLPLAFSLDWQRPARQMNSTSFFYNHTSQWRHEKLAVSELCSADSDESIKKLSLIDFNAKAERLGFLPSAPQLTQNPLDITKEAKQKGLDPIAYTVAGLRDRSIVMSCLEPDNPKNFPRNMFIWRSNLLGCAGKGHEYFLKYLLGTDNAVFSDEKDCIKPSEVKQGEACQGKLDLLVTLDFRFSSTCMYSDIVLPSATWYEKDDLNTSDMHPFIHPFNQAVNPLFESKTDFEIFKGIAKKFSQLAKDYLGIQDDLVLTPLMHDSPQELAQAYDVKDWYKGECDIIPGKTTATMTVVTRDYGSVYDKYVSVGPLLEKLGNGGKGISWDTKDEVQALRERNGTVHSGVAKNQPRIDTAIDAAEVILNLAPETNGHVAVKAWKSLSNATGLDHTHLAKGKEEEQIHFKDIVEQPRKIITSPIWSGIESHKVSYNSGYTNVHEFIPWRTLTGRQQFYLDHQWMRAFAEEMCIYKPPVDFKTTQRMQKKMQVDSSTVVLNFMTPHQKWGIHSMYTENPRMLTLSRGGPHAWISENSAKAIGASDNDWIELVNENGAVVVRAVVSQRVPDGVIIMYHAQEKIVNTPISNMSKQRGGIHNSMTRTVLKPTHMIGGYAQFAYGFNYYGTVGSNRDDYVVVRKVENLKWDVV